MKLGRAGSLREQPRERVRVAAVVQEVSERRRRDADIVAERQLGEGDADEGVSGVVHVRVEGNRGEAEACGGARQGLKKPWNTRCSVR